MIYGCPWHALSNANITIGQFPQRQISIRFRAKQQVKQIVPYLKAGAGYSGGDGGRVFFALRPDTFSGIPGDYVQDWAALLTSLPLLESFWNLVFDAKMDPGVWHLVLSNYDEIDPLTNYVSLNSLDDGGIQPPGCDGTLAVLTKDSGIWQPIPHLTPIIGIQYADGTWDGQGYYECLSQSGVVELTDLVQVRQKIASPPSIPPTYWKMNVFASSLKKWIQFDKFSWDSQYLYVPKAAGHIYPMVKGGKFPVTPNTGTGWAELSTDGGQTWAQHKNWDWPVYVEG